MEEKEIQRISNSFEELKITLNIANAAFRAGLNKDSYLEDAMFHLFELSESALDMIKKIAPDRFKPREILSKSIHYPVIDKSKFHTCDICGDHTCESDHK